MKITSLTSKQANMIAIMWGIDTKYDLEFWQNSLSSEDYNLCIAIQDLLLAEYIDEVVVDSSDITESVRLIIDNAKLPLSE